MKSPFNLRSSTILGVEMGVECQNGVRCDNKGRKVDILSKVEGKISLR